MATYRQAKSYIQKKKESVEDAQERLESWQAALANFTDRPEGWVPNTQQAERIKTMEDNIARDTAKVQYATALYDYVKGDKGFLSVSDAKRRDYYERLVSDFQKSVGITKKSDLEAFTRGEKDIPALSSIQVKGGAVRTATGYITSTEAAETEAFKKAKAKTGAVGRTGEALTINKDTFEVIGEDTGKVYGKGESLAQALALQTQLQSGSTPSVSGRPDLFAIDPVLPEEIAAVEAGTARVATLEELEQVAAGTLPTLEAEQAAKAAAGAAAGADASTSIASALESSVTAAETAALEADPDLVVTDEMRAAWLEEAWDEIKSNKYYQETIRLAELDIGTSIDRLIEDTRAREAALVKQYGEALTSTQKSLQARGLLYGGVRAGEERELAEEANVLLSAEDIALKRGLEDVTAGAERYLGSERSFALAPTLGTTQEVGRVLAGTPTFEAGKEIETFAPIGDIYGSLVREQEEEARVRAGEKETSFRDLYSVYA